MKCHKYRDMIPLYAMSELDESQKAKLEKHFRECLSCREQLEEIKQAIGAFAAAESESLSEIEKLKMEREIYRSLAAGIDEKSLTISGFNLAKVLLRVAAVIIIFLFGFGVRHIITVDKEPKIPEYKISQGVYALSDSNWSQVPGLRFSAEGFKLIAKGKSALESK